MAMSRTTAGTYFGPGQKGLERPGPRVDILSRMPQRTARIPSSVRRELSQLAELARRADDRPARKVAEDAGRILLQRATMGATAADAERLEEVGYDRWLEEQLDYEALDDGELEDALHEALPSLGLEPEQLFARYLRNPFVPVFELWSATLYRAVYSPRQLFERMAVFWADHFSIDVFGDAQFVLKPVDDRVVTRTHALTTFPEILSASAHSPSMLIYLTNDSNVEGHPNENYARELMELHTMGADNGYTETDVKEVARCFTGWTWVNPYRPANLGVAGQFRFSSFTHEGGSKRVLGRTIAAGGGINDGERVLEILVGRPETAEFIATKLLRYLHGYEPASRDIKAVKRVFQNTDGNIRAMVRTILRQKRLRKAAPKLKRPFHLFVSALRALGAELRRSNYVLGSLNDAGHSPFAWSPPNGYPDSAEYWSGFVMPRFDFAANMLSSWNEDIAIDEAIDASAAPAAVVKRLDALLLGGAMSKATHNELIRFLKKGSRNRAKVRDAIGLVVSSPEFQEY